jgi:hypothetical protein
VGPFSLAAPSSSFSALTASDSAVASLSGIASPMRKVS